MGFGKITPILRIFDEAKALEFYVDFLGFSVDWQHRFEADYPLYLQVSRDGCVLHLSEHHGDASPGAALRIETDALDACMLAEMAQVAEAAGDMGQAARRRAQSALAWRKPAAPVDISTLEAELAGLMKDAPHVQN